MSLLDGASPRVALRTLDVMNNFITLPQGGTGAPILFAKRLFSALLGNSAVMSPLVQFVFLNANVPPSSDLEIVALKGGLMIHNLCCADVGSGKSLDVEACAMLPPGRCEKHKTVLHKIVLHNNKMFYESLVLFG